MARPHGLRSSTLSPFVPLGWRCFSWHASLEGLVWFIIKGTDEFPNTSGQRWAHLLSQATDRDCSQNSLLCDIFEEARGYVKVLLNIQVGCVWRS